MLLLGVFVYVIFDSLHEKIVVVGDTAPDFSITADNGRTITAVEFRRQTPGAELLGDLVPALRRGDAVAQRVPAAASPSSGVVVLGVSVDKDEKAYRDFLRAPASLSSPRAIPDNKINADYGTFKFPETYIIDRKGKVCEKIISAQNWIERAE